MGVGISLFLFAAGAVMRFAVTADAVGWNVQIAGVVLMIVGTLGLLLSIFFWSTWGGVHRGQEARQSSAPVQTQDPRV